MVPLELIASLAILALLIGGIDQYTAIGRYIITLLRSTLLHFIYLPTLPYFIYLTLLYLLFFSLLFKPFYRWLHGSYPCAYRPHQPYRRA